MRAVLSRRAVACATVLVVAAVAAACAPLPTRDIFASHEVARARERRATPPPSASGFAPANATVAARLDTVERVWRTIADFYYDSAFPGVDPDRLRRRTEDDVAAARSDAEFYRALKRNVDALHDSHTEILSPEEAEEERTDAVTRIGIGYDVVDAHLVIEQVLAGFPADEAGIRRGMLVDAIDGTAIDAAFLDAAATAKDDEDPIAAAEPERPRERQLRAIAAMLVSKEGPPRPHRLALRRADDSTFDAVVLARIGDVPTVERYELLPSGVGVLKLSRFDPSVRRRLARDLELARRESRALVLDLRENPGGDIAVFEWLVERFIDRPAVLGTMVTRRRKQQIVETIDGEPADDPYRKPVAILVDRATGSAAEWTAHALVELTGAIAVGEPTCGCVVGIRREFVLPDDGVLRVAEIGFRSPHGRRMEDDPLVPTLAVAPTLAERRAGDDVVLRAAETALATSTAGRR